MVSSNSYNLKMIGVHIYGKDNVFSDNDVGWKSDRWPKVTINKKHVSICFHSLYEALDIHVMHF